MAVPNVPGGLVRGRPSVPGNRPRVPLGGALQRGGGGVVGGRLPNPGSPGLTPLPNRPPPTGGGYKPQSPNWVGSRPGPGGREDINGRPTMPGNWGGGPTGPRPNPNPRPIDTQRVIFNGPGRSRGGPRGQTVSTGNVRRIAGGAPQLTPQLLQQMAARRLGG